MSEQPILRAQGVCFAYPQHGLGLALLDLEARAGELWAITGRSGCGKSTLVRCLNGLIPHLYHGEMGGHVWVDGQDTRDTPLWKLCESAGMLFQNPAAQSLGSSVAEEILFGLENLGLPADEQRAQLGQALERFHLGALGERPPDTLSGGEMQRVMLAAILARHPRALLLDEPFSMLDTTAATELAAHLGELVRAGVTVVACEHRPDYLRELAGYRERCLPSSRPPVEAPLAALPDVDGLPRCQRVTLRGLRLGFGERHLFRDLSLTLHGGEVLALVGRNGTGKTTLLRALAGLHRPFGGEILADEGTHPDLGLVFQNPDWQLFNPTVREEICFRLAEPDVTLYHWLLQALSLERYEAVPPLLLSEGEKKRTALATLLMRKPAHGLLLDEPTLGQDDGHRQVMGALARHLARAGGVVVAATHDLRWAATYADRLVLLGDGAHAGEVVADGQPALVLADGAAWKRAGLVVPTWLRAAA